jgi:hypothetical protein
LWLSGHQDIRVINGYSGAILRLRSGQVATLQIDFFALFVVQKSVQLTYDAKNGKSLEKREPPAEIQTDGKLL